jgi:uncharacterized paraquat-inducible protein A
MLPSAAEMQHTRTDLYHGLFTWQAGASGAPRVGQRPSRPEQIPCPTTGRLLRIATVEAEASAICPRCAKQGQGGFVSFVGDLRMAYACPQCLELVWAAGA